jgi:Flp pilus assembly protein TadD
MKIRGVWIMKYFLTVALAVGALLATGSAFAAGSSSTTTASVPFEFSQAKKMVEAKNYKSAVPLLEKVVKKQTKNADAWNLLAYSNRKLENFDVALTQYKTALKIQPMHKGANEYLGELYLRVGELPKAQEQLAVLNRMCTDGFVGCAEYNELKDKVAVFISSQGS